MLAYYRICIDWPGVGDDGWRWTASRVPIGSGNICGDVCSSDVGAISEYEADTGILGCLKFLGSCFVYVHKYYGAIIKMW